MLVQKCQEAGGEENLEEEDLEDAGGSGIGKTCNQIRNRKVFI
jgi:hypothetical protein